MQWVCEYMIDGAGWVVVLIPGGGNWWLVREVRVEGVGGVVPVVGLRPGVERVRFLVLGVPWGVEVSSEDEVCMGLFFLYGVDLALDPLCGVAGLFVVFM